jgi:hypothetical protein
MPTKHHYDLTNNEDQWCATREWLACSIALLRPVLGQQKVAWFAKKILILTSTRVHMAVDQEAVGDRDRAPTWSFK